MPNKILQIAETPITWKSASGTRLFTPASLASNAGHQGAQHDLSTTARARRFAWRARCKFGDTPVVGEVIEIYLKYSDGTYPDNSDGTGDIAISSEDKLANATPIGCIVVDQADITVFMVGSGTIEIDHQFISPIFFNRTTAALSSTATDMGFELTPIVDEIQ